MVTIGVSEQSFEFGEAGADAGGLALEEVVAVFSIAETIAAGHVGRVVFHVDGQLFIIEQQLALLLNLLQYVFAGHHCC